MSNSTLELVGFIAGTAALSYATFTAVSFIEIQKKVQAGLEDPNKYYPKQPPQQKPKPVAPAAPKKKKSGKRCVIGSSSLCSSTAYGEEPRAGPGRAHLHVGHFTQVHQRC